MNTALASSPRTQRAILFDWGDTLMRVFPQCSGPMSTWPQVAAMPHALDALSDLHPDYTLCLATNAADSLEADIRLALARVDLDRYLDQIYCYRKIGYKKPLPEFFNFILEDLALQPSQVVMVGDDYDADILGALNFGIRSVWVTTTPNIKPSDPRLKIIPDLSLLPSFVQELLP